MVAYRLTVERLAARQCNHRGARHAMLLVDVAALFDVSRAHVRVEAPQRRIFDKRRVVLLAADLPPAGRLVDGVVRALFALDKRPLEYASPVQIAGCDDALALALVASLGKLIVDRRHHGLGALLRHIYHGFMNHLLVKLLRAFQSERRRHLFQQRLELDRRQRRIRRVRDEVVSIPARREKQIHHAGIGGADLGLRALRKCLGSIPDASKRLRVIAALELPQVHQPPLLDRPAVGLGALKLSHEDRRQRIEAARTGPRRLALLEFGELVGHHFGLIVHQYPACEAGPA